MEYTNESVEYGRKRNGVTEYGTETKEITYRGEKKNG